MSWVKLSVNGFIPNNHKNPASRGILFIMPTSMFITPDDIRRTFSIAPEFNSGFFVLPPSPSIRLLNLFLFISLSALTR